MVEEDYGIVPLSPKGRNIEELKSKGHSLDVLRRTVEDLTIQTNKMVGLNMSLQSKIIELLIRVTDLIEDVKEMVSLLKSASELPPEKELTAEFIEKMLKQNQEYLENNNKLLEFNRKALESIKNVEKYIKRLYRKQLIETLKKKE